MNLKLKIKIMEHYPSQNHFARVIGVDVSELSKFIHGWRVPKPELQDLIAKKLECSPDELFSRPS